MGSEGRSMKQVYHSPVLISPGLGRGSIELIQILFTKHGLVNTYEEAGIAGRFTINQY